MPSGNTSGGTAKKSRLVDEFPNSADSAEYRALVKEQNRNKPAYETATGEESKRLHDELIRQQIAGRKLSGVAKIKLDENKKFAEQSQEYLNGILEKNGAAQILKNAAKRAKIRKEYDTELKHELDKSNVQKENVAKVNKLRAAILRTADQKVYKDVRKEISDKAFKNDAEEVYRINGAAISLQAAARRQKVRAKYDTELKKEISAKAFKNEAEEIFQRNVAATSLQAAARRQQVGAKYDTELKHELDKSNAATTIQNVYRNRNRTRAEKEDIAERRFQKSKEKFKKLQEEMQPLSNIQAQVNPEIQAAKVIKSFLKKEVKNKDEVMNKIRVGIQAKKLEKQILGNVPREDISRHQHHSLVEQQRMQQQAAKARNNAIKNIAKEAAQKGGDRYIAQESATRLQRAVKNKIARERARAELNSKREVFNPTDYQDQLRANKKKQQDILSEDRTRTQQPKDKVRIANKIIESISQLTAPRRLGRPPKESLGGRLSLEPTPKKK